MIRIDQNKGRIGQGGCFAWRICRGKWVVMKGAKLSFSCHLSPITGFIPLRLTGVSLSVDEEQKNHNERRQPSAVIIGINDYRTLPEMLEDKEDLFLLTMFKTSRTIMAIADKIAENMAALMNSPSKTAL